MGKDGFNSPIKIVNIQGTVFKRLKGKTSQLFSNFLGIEQWIVKGGN